MSDIVETPATDSESISDWIGVTSRTNSTSSASPSSSSALSGCVGVRSEAAERVSTSLGAGNNSADIQCADSAGMCRSWPSAWEFRGVGVWGDASVGCMLFWVLVNSSADDVGYKAKPGYLLDAGVFGGVAGESGESCLAMRAASSCLRLKIWEYCGALSRIIEARLVLTGIPRLSIWPWCWGL